MAFFLFILVNAALFIRPAELSPESLRFNVYLGLIVLCFAAAIPDILGFLTARPLDRQPITLCVLGLQVAVVLPPLVMMDFSEAFDAGFDFLKVTIYYLLFVSLVTTPERLHQFIFWLLVFTFILAALPVLQYHGVIEVPNLSKLVENDVDPVTKEIKPNDRLRGSGIFRDPNDLCVMLAAMTPLALFLLTKRNGTVIKILWAAEILLFGYVVFKTQSRGGLLAVLGGLGAFAWARFGWRRAAALGMLALPALLVFVGGRQTDFSTQHGTSQGRLQIWSDWLSDFRANPIVGQGRALGEEPDGTKRTDLPYKYVAHNSYLQAFADLGFIGGTLFLGAFVLSIWTLMAYRTNQTVMPDPELGRLQPYLIGAIAAYAVGMISLSLNYLTPTFMIPALAAVIPRMVGAWPPAPEIRFDGRLAGRLGLVSVFFLVGLYVFVRLFVNRI